METDHDELNAMIRAATAGTTVVRGEPPEGNDQLNDFVRTGRWSPATGETPAPWHLSTHPAAGALLAAADAVLTDPSAVLAAIENDDQLDRMFVGDDGEVDEGAVRDFVHEVARRLPSLRAAQPGSFDGGARNAGPRPGRQPSISDQIRQAALNQSRLRQGLPVGRGNDLLQ